MNTSSGQRIAGVNQPAPSFMQIVQDDGHWFEPRDIVRLVLRPRLPTVGRLVKAKRGRFEVEACAPMVTGHGRCLEVLLREIRPA